MGSRLGKLSNVDAAHEDTGGLRDVAGLLGAGLGFVIWLGSVVLLGVG